MKLLSFILSLLPILYSGLGSGYADELRIKSAECSVSDCSETRGCTGQCFNNELCLAAVQNCSFFGNNGTGGSPVRTSVSGRRPSQRQMQLAFVSNGKLFSIKALLSFLNRVASLPSGTLAAERYLFVICRLRL